MQIVHVIGPGGPDTRHEERYADDVSPADVLADLEIKHLRYGQWKGKFLLDYPETVVAIGTIGPKNVFVETKRLRGPGTPAGAP